MFGQSIVKRFFKVNNSDFVNGVFTENYYEEVNYGGHRKVFQLARKMYDTGLENIFDLKRDRSNVKIEEIMEEEYNKIKHMINKYSLADKLTR